MKTSITLRSPGALLLALFFASVTARTIFDDVWNGAPVTTAHLQSLAAIIGTLASAHFLWPAFRQAKIVTFLGMALIFTASTGYVVISAGARNAQVSQVKIDDAAEINQRRSEAQSKVTEAETELAKAKSAHDQAVKAAAKECASGKGLKCKGQEATRDSAAQDVDRADAYAILMRAKRDVIKPATNPHAGYAHAAKVIAALPGVTATAERIEASVELLLPFGVVLISEIGTLVFGSLALGHRTTVPGKLPAIASGKSVPAIPEKRIPGNPKAPRNGQRGRKSDPRVVQFSEAFSRKHGRAPTGSEIKSEFPELPTSTAYDYSARARGAAVPGLRLVAG